MQTKSKTFPSKLLRLSTLLLLTVLVNFTSADSRSCQSTDSFFCNIVNVTYRTFRPFRNNFGHETPEDARSALHKIDNTELPTDYLLPCRDICEEAHQCEPQIRSAMNSSWPEKWNCENFQYYENNKLCVKNTQKETVSQFDIPESPVAPLSSESVKQTPPPTNQSVEIPCESGFFDCQSGDPKQPYCIEQKFVCDGNPDCHRPNGLVELGGISRDEVDCGIHCEDGQIFCDARCIDRHDRCNGIPDCSSGIDEQNCFDNITIIIQSVECIFVLMATVYIIVWFLRLFRESEDKDQSYDTIYNQDNHAANHAELYAEDQIQSIITQKAYPTLPPAIFPSASTLEPSHYGEPSIHSCRESYEVSSVILDRSDYDRIIPGGNSGASSIYDSTYHQTNPHPLELKSTPQTSSNSREHKPTPPAPPPTPALDRPNFYENLDEM